MNQKTYITKSGDQWDSIAYKMLGSVQYTDQLIRANLDYRNYYIFPSGITLNLPDVTSDTYEELPSWKRGVG